MSSHDLSKFEAVARQAWEATTSIEADTLERVKQFTQGHLENHWPGWQIGTVCQHRLPDGSAIFFVGTVKRSKSLREGSLHSTIEIGHYLVMEQGEGFVILPEARHHESEDGDG